jgi:hypothetical protein
MLWGGETRSFKDGGEVESENVVEALNVVPYTQRLELQAPWSGAFDFSVTGYWLRHQLLRYHVIDPTNRLKQMWQFPPLTLIIPNYLGAMHVCRFFFRRPPFTLLFMIPRRQRCAGTKTFIVFGAFLYHTVASIRDGEVVNLCTKVLKWVRCSSCRWFIGSRRQLEIDSATLTSHFCFKWVAFTAERNGGREGYERYLSLI